MICGKTMNDNDSDYIGLSLAAAETLAQDRDLQSRIVMTDGVSHMVTMDFRVDRVNFTIRDGKVEEVTRG